MSSGAVFWMWVTAVLGGASAFTESTLAQVYKKRGSHGQSYGGPACYIEEALHSAHPERPQYSRHVWDTPKIF